MQIIWGLLKDVAKKEKLSINLIMNYSIINMINNFVTKYEKIKNMIDKITNTIFNKEKVLDYVCFISTVKM